MDHHQHSHGGHEHHAGDFDFDAMADQLDAEAGVLADYLADALGWVRGQAGDLDVRRVLDLGAGTGPATIALARLWPGAEVIAVDGSAALLARLRDKAAAAGVAGRIHGIQADLDGDWPDTGDQDLIWTSLTLHHLADPKRALGELYGRLRSGGLLAVAELTSSLRFLPDDLGIGQPGLEERMGVVFGETHAAALPHLDAPWDTFLSQAGFADVASQIFAIDLAAPLPPSANRFVQGSLRRAREQLGGALSPDDLAALDALLSEDGPHSVLHRTDLTVRGARTVWTGRRP